MSRGRSPSPRHLGHIDDGSDTEMRSVSPPQGREMESTDLKVLVVTNLTRNVVESHLRTIFGAYGEIKKIDLPVFAKSGQNRGKAALEYVESAAAEKAVLHMNKGQIDGAILNVELSNTILRDRSRSRSPRVPRINARNGRGTRRSPSRSLSPPRRRNIPPPPRDRERYRSKYSPPRRRSPNFDRRRGPPGRSTYRPRSISRSRSRSPPRRRGLGRTTPPRRSPSYERGGTGYRARRSRSRSSYSLASSRSRTRSYSSRSRSRSYSYSSRSSRRTRSRSLRSSRSRNRDDIRDSRSRSRSPL